MPEPHIVIGTPNLSSWSLRPWLLLHDAGVPFGQTVIDIERPDRRQLILEHSPAGKVPVLKHVDNLIWESLAICEYLAELQPERGWWPAAAPERARARTISSEMHAGFAALRQTLPMNIRARGLTYEDSPEVAADIARIIAIWQDCLGANGGGRKGEPFLFGRFGIVDAMFAPVVSRFRSYGVALDGSVADYAEALWQHPGMQAWAALRD
ncbi:MAG: glutathione S-transferase family protein [Alphaproteobacteria bacterium]|nr:glutathione S-transferase family protein [Alphaproteobacteria bacterium]